MTYSIHLVTFNDEKIADFASNRGLQEFREVVEAGNYPNLLSLLDEGASDGKGVDQELRSIAENAPANVASSARIVIEAINSISDDIEAMVLSNGVTGGPKVDDEPTRKVATVATTKDRATKKKPVKTKRKDN